MLTPSNGLSFQRRVTTAGTSDNSASGPVVAPPYWTRLVRAGSTFTGYGSSNGLDWVVVGATNLTGFNSSALWGLAVTAHNNTNLSRATFDNVALNQPPIIAPVPSTNLTAGQTVQVTNSATDPDLPAQTLIWTLLSAPTNAVFDPATGLFTWRPLISQSPSTNPVVLKLTDNGSPSLAATQNITVTVTRPASPQAPVRLGVGGPVHAHRHRRRGPGLLLVVRHQSDAADSLDSPANQQLTSNPVRLSGPTADQRGATVLPGAGWAVRDGKKSVRQNSPYLVVFHPGTGNSNNVLQAPSRLFAEADLRLKQSFHLQTTVLLLYSHQ